MSEEKIDIILAKTIRIESALWPDEGQPGVLKQHGDRLDKLESWRNWIAGAGAVITTFLGLRASGK